MTPDEMKEELALLLEETTSVIGATDATYIRFLKMAQGAGKLSVPTRLFVGQMVFFKYKPRSESIISTNTYYDKYPLVLVTDVYRGGFSGVNVHYLDPIRRTMLFDVIMRDLPTIKMGEEWRTRLRVNYDRLVARRQFKFFKPCFKRYSWKGMKRRPIVVPFELWEDMVASNTMKFEKAKPITVFRDSYKAAIKQR